MSCSDCISSTTSSSAMKAASSASVGSAEPSSNPEAGAPGGGVMYDPLAESDGAPNGSKVGGESDVKALLERGAEADSG
eukprot:scaffold100519_cov54-Phaeocystis_antarctica.AAC.4